MIGAFANHRLRLSQRLARSFHLLFVVLRQHYLGGSPILVDAAQPIACLPGHHRLQNLRRLRDTSSELFFQNGFALLCSDRDHVMDKHCSHSLPHPIKRLQRLSQVTLSEKEYPATRGKLVDQICEDLNYSSRKKGRAADSRPSKSRQACIEKQQDLRESGTSIARSSSHQTLLFAGQTNATLVGIYVKV